MQDRFSPPQIAEAFFRRTRSAAVSANARSLRASSRSKSLIHFFPWSPDPDAPCSHIFLKSGPVVRLLTSRLPRHDLHQVEPTLTAVFGQISLVQCRRFQHRRELVARRPTLGASVSVRQKLPLAACLRPPLVQRREPPRVYRRAKLSENCPLWNRHKRRRPRSRIHLSSASVRFGWLWNTAMNIRAKLRRLRRSQANWVVRQTADPVWARQVQRDGGERPGPTSAEKARIKELERQNRELRQANEILRKASAYFAQAELDRPFRK